MPIPSALDPERAAREICTTRSLTFDRTLGSGAVGDVFLVRGAGARYALKVLRNREAPGLESFEREMKALVDHPSPFTVRIYAFGTTPAPWYLMDHHEMSLAQWITAHPDRDTERDTAERFLNDALCGLAEWHGRTPRVVHGDINPGNILVDPVRASAVLADPSLAALRGPRGTDLTGGGLIGGTRGYADPSGNVRTAAADVYAMGATMYAVLARRLEMPDSLADAVGDDMKLTGAERGIILKALERDVAARFADAAEMFEAFEGNPVGDVGPADPSPSRSFSAGTTAYALGFVALVGVIVFGVWTGRRADVRGVRPTAPASASVGTVTARDASPQRFAVTTDAGMGSPVVARSVSFGRVARPVASSTPLPAAVVSSTPIPPTIPQRIAALWPVTASASPSPSPTPSHPVKAQDRATPPPSGWELIDQARIALEQGDRNRAQGLYRQAAAHAESRADANRALGLLYFKVGAYAGAVDHLERYLSLRPEAPDRREIENLISRSRS